MSVVDILAIDLGKRSFQVCSTDRGGAVLFNRTLSRAKLMQMLDRAGAVHRGDGSLCDQPLLASSGAARRTRRPVDIRKLLIVGAISRIRWIIREGVLPDNWLGKLVGRKPRMVAAVALANKMARIIWAIMTRELNYRTA